LDCKRPFASKPAACEFSHGGKSFLSLGGDPLIDETKDNGWVKIRRNVLAHLADGRLTPAEFSAFLFLLLTASSSNGETQTCARVIATLHQWDVRTAQRALSGLRSKGYIEGGNVLGKRRIYKVRVLKFEITTGPQKGMLTEPSVSLTMYQRAADTGTEVTLTPSQTLSLMKPSQASGNKTGYGNSFTDSVADGVTEPVADLSLRMHQRVAEDAPIQEEDCREREKSNSNCLARASQSRALQKQKHGQEENVTMYDALDELTECVFRSAVFAAGEIGYNLPDHKVVRPITSEGELGIGDFDPRFRLDAFDDSDPFYAEVKRLCASGVRDFHAATMAAVDAVRSLSDEEFRTQATDRFPQKFADALGCASLVN
jgi:hypothetical protein